MCNVLDSSDNGNSPRFTGAVGRGPTRLTPYGQSIDVVRTDSDERLWIDLVPTNPEIMESLRCGVRIEVTDVEIIRHGRRPMWRGKVRLVER